MISRFAKHMGIKREKDEKKDFSGFFRHASEREKEELLTDVVKKAQEDQRELLERHKKEFESAS